MNHFLQTECWRGVLIVTVGYIFYYGLFKIPPVTLAVVIMQMLSFAGYITDMWDCDGAPIPEHKVLEDPSWSSIYALNLERKSHGLLFPIVISWFIFVGAYLEPKYGSIHFALLLGFIAPACGLMHMFFVWALTPCFNMCSMAGLTSMLLTLQMITSVEMGYVKDGNCDSVHKLLPFILLYGYWIFVDKQSFYFQCGGIAVGFIYICVEPMGTLIDKVISGLSERDFDNFRVSAT